MVKPLYNSRDTQYKNPFGAVKVDTKVVFSVCLPKDFSFASLKLKMKNPLGGSHDIQMVYDKTEDGYIYYSCEFKPSQSSVYFYYFSASLNNEVSYIKRDHSSIGYLTKNPNDPDFQITVFDKNAKTPDSFKGGIMYQIFPDRFYYSKTRKSDVPSDRLLRSDFGGLPNFVPDENGEVLNDDYFCGDLKGIEEKLPYLKSLGVTILYLNPIFEAHSSHRYNTADYMSIDPLLGTQDDFISLCKKAKKHKIKIILDGVFNHTGDDSVYFNKKGRYDVEGAYNSISSQYHSWYMFNDYPDGYHSWWGFNSLPTISKNDESFENFICGKDGVIKKWLKLGASGFRLDVADELTDEFILKIRKSLKEESEENLLVGEVWEDASHKEAYGVLRRYFMGDELDSTMNYPFRNAIINFVKTFDKPTFINDVMTIVENYPPQNLHVAMNLLSTHDVPRAITSIMGPSCEGKDRNWQSRHVLSIDEYEKGVVLLKFAMVLQYFLPGIPCIYYGDEAGLQGYRDPFNRKCYPWNNEDRDLIEFTIMLSKLRKSCSTLKEGGIEFFDINKDILSFKRFDGRRETILHLNYSTYPIQVKFDAKKYKLKHGKLSSDKNLLIEPLSFGLIEN